MRIKKNKNNKGYTIIEKQVNNAYTNGEYVRLGERLRTYNRHFDIPREDLEILQTLRTSYKKPLSQIFDVLQNSISKINRNAIITYRIKRIDSIISKLNRLPNAQLPRIEDIAGCRCILKSNLEVYKLKELLGNELFIKSDRNDYIAKPKPDGYKSLHLIVQTKDKLSRPIELQLRTEKDHNWATLVEITDQVYNTKIKEFGDEPELGRMLFLLSKGFEMLTKDELIELIELIQKKDFVGRINGVFINNSIKVRKQWSEIERRKDRNFYLIQVDKENNSHISSYPNFNEAEKAYFEKFIDKSEQNIVLTHIPNAKFEQISKAYSNYTLTYHDFFQDLLSVLQKLVKVSFSESNFKDFSSHFTLFVFIYFEVAKLQINELFVMQQTKCKSFKKVEWQKDIDVRLKKTIMKRHELFRDINFNWYNIFHILLNFKKNRIWKQYANSYEQSIKKLSEKI
jgi:ppGpp synthetase/RelA/SpoT-type nucleotidyltranferase